MSWYVYYPIKRTGRMQINVKNASNSFVTNEHQMESNLGLNRRSSLEILDIMHEVHPSKSKLLWTFWLRHYARLKPQMLADRSEFIPFLGKRFPHWWNSQAATCRRRYLSSLTDWVWPCLVAKSHQEKEKVVWRTEKSCQLLK